MSRLNQQKVEEQINEERLKFYKSAYVGEVAIPKNILVLFRDALFFGTPPIEHQIHVASIRRILGKKTHDLTVAEIGSIINVVAGTSFSKIYEDLNQALDSHEAIEKFIRHYNDNVAVFNKALDKKQATLMQLIQPGGNGMRKIIASA